MGKKILVLGATGAMGQYLVPLLAGSGHQVTAVALTSGSASRSDYNYGVAIFVVPDQGLMVDASVGGQKFQYEPAFIMYDEPTTVIP